MRSNRILLSIIMVNYHSRHFIEDCLLALSKNIDQNLIKRTEILISNNSPTETLSKRKLLRTIPELANLKIISNKHNLGFGRANNKGAKQAQGKYLLFLNSDVEITKDFLSPMVQFYQKKHRIGFLSPRLLISNGKTQLYAYGSKPSLRTSILNKIYQILPIDRHQNKSYKSSQHDWIAGTCLMVSKKIFQKLGCFDSRFFMYYEDVDLCLRARKNGLNNYTLNTVHLIHYGGEKISKHKDLYYESQDKFNRKYHGLAYQVIYKALRKFYNDLKTKGHRLNPLRKKTALKILIIVTASILTGFIGNQYSYLIPIIALSSIAFIIMSFIYTEKVLLLIIFLLPLQFSIVTNHYIPYIRILIPLFIIIWTIKALSTNKFLVPIESTAIISFLLIGTIIFSIAISRQTEGMGKFLLLLSFFPFFIACRNIIQHQKNRGNLLKNILRTILYSSILVNLIGLGQFLLQFLFGLEPTIRLFTGKIGSFLWSSDLAADIIISNSWIVDFKGKVILRTFSIFSSPHQYSFYLSLILPISVALLVYSIYQKRNIIPRSLLYFSITITFICLVLTFSRGAYISFFLAFLICGLYIIKTLSPKNRTIVLAGLITVLICLSLLLYPIIGSRVKNLLNFKEASNAERVIFLKRSFNIFKENWLFGVGYGQFDTVTKFKGFDNNIKINAHNTYLELAIELGFFSAMLIFLLFIWPIFQFFKSKVETTIRNWTIENWLSIGIICTLLWLSINAIFEMLLYSPVILAFLMLFLAMLPRKIISN